MANYLLGLPIQHSHDLIHLSCGSWPLIFPLSSPPSVPLSLCVCPSLADESLVLSCPVFELATFDRLEVFDCLDTPFPLFYTPLWSSALRSNHLKLAS